MICRIGQPPNQVRSIVNWLNSLEVSWSALVNLSQENTLCPETLPLKSDHTATLPQESREVEPGRITEFSFIRMDSEEGQRVHFLGSASASSARAGSLRQSLERLKSILLSPSQERCPKIWFRGKKQSVETSGSNHPRCLIQGKWKAKIKSVFFYLLHTWLIQVEHINTCILKSE